MKKQLIRYLTIVLVMLGIGTIWGFSLKYKMQQICKEVRVEIMNDQDNYFIGITQLRKHLQEILYSETVDSRIIPKRMGEVNLNKVEKLLEENPFIRNAEVFRRNGGILEVRVQLKKAIARMTNMQGEQFYLDETGRLMPLSPYYTPNVILVGGRIFESVQAGDSLRTEQGRALLPLLQYVHADPFFSAQISEIVVDKDGNLILYPEAGSVKVEFGDTERYKEKFDHLQLFYKQVLQRTGWDRYKKISVQFRGQVVAEKRNVFDSDISEFN